MDSVTLVNEIPCPDDGGELTDELSDVSLEGDEFLLFGRHDTKNLYMAVRTQNKDMPCLYQWTEWSECSAPCTVNRSKPPIMKRIIINDTIVQARGKYSIIAPCPDNVSTLTDIAPCNTHICSRNLSSFKFLHMFILNGRCQIMRDIPLDNSLIFIDGNLYKECEATTNPHLVMEQARLTTEQLRNEANIQRKKVSEVAKDLIEYCESKKTGDCLISGPADHNPFQEKKSCVVL